MSTHIRIVLLFCFQVTLLHLEAKAENPANIRTSYFQTTSYSEDFSDAIKKTFIPFENEISRGLSNGVYWLKIENLGEEQIIEIPSARILDIKAYSVKGIEIEKIGAFNFPSFKIKRLATIYLKVNCQKEAFIPINIHALDSYWPYIQNLFFTYGFYYGFAFMVVILNLFYFFTFKDKTFLLYCFVVIIISSGLFHSDGLTAWFFRNEWLIKDGEIIPHVLLPIIGTFFSSVYLQYDIYFPKLKYWFTVLSLSQIFAFAMYLITQDFKWFALAEFILFALVLTSYWLSAVFLFNKSDYAKFFAIAYVFIFLMSCDFYMAPLFGLPSFGMGTNMVKVGGVLELLVLSYAVMFRMKAIQKENTEMKDALYEYSLEITQLEVQFNKLKEGKENTLTKASLNEREIEVITLISEGLSNTEIADKLFISVNTVKYHIKNLYNKLEIRSRQEARKKAAEIKIQAA